VIDKAVPQWLQERFAPDYERIFERLSKLWGRNLNEKPQILFNVANFHKKRSHYNGVEMDGNKVVLEIGGTAVLKKNPTLVTRFYEILAHETSHLFQHQNDLLLVRHSGWIVEGTANAMTLQVLFQEGLIDDNYIQKRYSESYDSCRIALGSGMPSRRVLNYDCGELMALVADKAIGDNTLFSLWNRILKKSKTKAFTSKSYFKNMRALGANKAHIAQMKKLENSKFRGVTLATMGLDLSETLRLLMIDVGLNPQFDSHGNLISLDWQV